jgi:signal transduction histidine kinase
MAQQGQDPFTIPSPYTALQRNQRKRFVLALTRTAFAVALFLTILYAVLYLVRPSWQLAVFAGQGVPTLAIVILAHHLALRDKVELGAYIMLPYLLLNTGLFSVMLGLLAVIAPVFMAFIIVASMVLGAVGGYIIATVAAILWLIAYFILGLRLPPWSPLSTTTLTVVLVCLTEVSFYFAAFISRAATSGLWHALDDATYDLIQANRQLDEANRLKSRFVARMSHDLRTPLTAIGLSTDLTLRELYGPVTGKQQEVLNRVRDSTRRLQALVDDILDISKIEAGQLELVDRSFKVSALVDTVRSTLEPEALAKGVHLTFTLAPDMPPHIVGDENRLAQILLNLTDNAVKFTEQGEAGVVIEPLGSDRWRMEVRDTGRGIREADLEIIFEEFRQAEATTGETSGTGLGLAISRHLVELMGGEIHVHSRLGKGSTFEVILPLRVAAETPGPA